MEKFKSGNVVKLPNGMIVIIYGYRTVKLSKTEYQVVDWIDFESENCRGCTKVDSYIEKEEVFFDYDSEECPCEVVCDGCKREMVETTIPGINSAELLGDNVKDYIIDRLTKKFEF